MHRSPGAVVYSADRADGFYVLLEEGPLTELLEDDYEPAVTILRFDTAAARDTYLAARSEFDQRRSI